MNILFDLKYAWRVLTRSRGYALLCAAVVALSVGLVTFVYTLAYGAWLKPLEIPGSERWYVVHAAPNATAVPQVHSLDAYTYQQILEGNRTVNHLGAVSIRPGVLSEDQASVNVRAYAVSPSLLAATQVAPHLGRIFTEAESYSESAAVAILGFEAWQSYFASDPNVVGKQARVNGESVQIIGVMPRGFSLGMLADLWLPLESGVLTADVRAAAVEPFIVLQPGQTREAVLREMNAAVERVNEEYPERYNARRHVVLAAAHRAFTDTGKTLPAMLAVLAAAVALLGSMNIGMMLFARLMERARELALRNSLGASRWRLLRQCLLESSVVVLFGLVLGIAFAYVWTSWAQGIFDRITVGQPYVNSAEFTIHAHHLVIAVLAAVLIWLLSTLIPAWRITRQDAAMVLAGSGKGTGGRANGKSASILVGLQVMISCTVLVTSSNAVLVWYSMEKRPKGFDTAGIVLSSVPTTFSAAYESTSQRSQYLDALASGIAGRISGADVAFATAVPGIDSAPPVRVATDGQDQQVAREFGPTRVTAVSENYFEILGISLRSGRWFDSTDNDTSLDVAVLDENFAQRFWPNEDPLGKRLRIGAVDNDLWVTIVGVVSHVGLGTDTQAFRGRVYVPMRQQRPSEFVVMVKPPESSLNVVETRAALTAAAFAVDRDLPLNAVQAMDTFFEERSGGFTVIFAVIGAITAFLAATGLFGLISRSVVLRTQEVGVRRAVGATQWQVTALFLRQGAMHLAVGVVLGGFLGIVATTRLGSLWPGILNYVVVVALGVFVALAFVILTASYLPTRRAVALEPGDALRYE